MHVCENATFSRNLLLETTKNNWSGVNRDDTRRDKAPDTAIKKAPDRSTGTDLGLVPHWTLKEYRSVCVSMTDLEPFGAMSYDSKNL